MHLARLTTFIAAAAVFTSATLHAEPAAAEAKDSKTIALFDGKTLDGWKIVGGNGQFKVEDGCIVGHGENVKGNTFLRTEKTYGDFELTFEFKFDDRSGNSGLMFRALQKPSKDGNGRVYGYQCEGDNGHARSWTAGLFDEKRRGWLFPDKKNKEQCAKFTAQGQKLFKWDDWNTIVIRCEGNHIQTWLNGEQRVDFTDTDKKDDTREGFFGLQVHSGKSCHVRWRNLQLKQL
ncbi:DUF1080 domain-containing protein [Verrucomicrobiaceae bacterium 5K15]|uniref:DUF1080 domain-containing protein n=1 Tax=Oceaniferula flava TaxID=2800421 RepID=A0AAE2SBK9_9BACT|nr:DUF1080 domain-containing protein [Oceaniferula flavus]MBK1854012.1 DUF1080 domain-containing protein [Oceaniferula flavus]MBM1135318.1 DUF1080 domain-containing protein [Oceaniferula flavus]